MTGTRAHPRRPWAGGYGSARPSRGRSPMAWAPAVRSASRSLAIPQGMVREAPRRVLWRFVVRESVVADDLRRAAEGCLPNRCERPPVSRVRG